MRRSYARTAIGLALAIVVILFGGNVLAAEGSQSMVVDGLTIYYGIIPAEELREFPQGSTEARAHTQIPKGKQVYHMVVAVFEGENMERVTDAKVTARVREIGLGWTRKPLEPTTLNNDLTYCNYFTFHDHTNYQIDIDVRKPGSADTITAAFDYTKQ